MPKKIANKQDWILKGYEAFAYNGEVGIVVEKIARSLKCNKSSFYWHFKTRQEFINNIIDYWKDKETEVILNIVSTARTPNAQFDKLIELSFKKSLSADFAFFLKQYANKNPQLLYELELIERKRIDFVTLLISDFGIEKEQARVKASILNRYMTGYHDSLRCRGQRPDYIHQVKMEIRHFLGF
jgi:AcrR family transcriptional regulator